MKGTPVRSLRSNFSWTLVGNGVYGACQWGMLFALARVGTPQMVGIYAFAQALTSPIVLFSNLQLRSIQATDTQHQYSFGQYLALRTLTTAAALICILALVLMIGYERETAWVVVIVGLAKSVESFSDVYFGYLQKYEEMGRIARSMMIKGLVSIGAFTATVWATKSIIWGAVAILISWLTVLIFYDTHSTRLIPSPNNTIDWSWRHIRDLSILSFPLGITMMLISLNANIPRYFLEHFQGTRSLGLFSVLATMQTAGSLVVMALGNSAAPRLARQYDEGNWHGFSKLIFQLCAICTGMGLIALLVVAVAGDRLVTLVFGKAYAGQNDTFLWIAATAMISYASSVFGYAATASRRIRFQPKVYTLVALLTGGGCYYLVPAQGGKGAAITMCLAAFVGLILYFWSFLDSAKTCRSSNSDAAEVPLGVG